jgi:hypothetical protein
MSRRGLGTGAGRPRLYADDAARQRAYRLRRRALRNDVTVDVQNPSSITLGLPSVTFTTPFSDKKHCPSCTCTRVYPSNAVRQAAYRERRGVGAVA